MFGSFERSHEVSKWQMIVSDDDGRRGVHRLFRRAIFIEIDFQPLPILAPRSRVTVRSSKRFPLLQGNFVTESRGLVIHEAACVEVGFANGKVIEPLHGTGKGPAELLRFGEVRGRDLRERERSLPSFARRLQPLRHAADVDAFRFPESIRREGSRANPQRPTLPPVCHARWPHSPAQLHQADDARCVATSPVRPRAVEL